MARFSPTLSLIKQRIPTPLIDFINFIYGAIDPLMIASYQKQNAWNKPIPPFELRRITAKRSVANFVQSGKRISDALVEGLRTTGKEINEIQTVLDFGCGAGRQVQYFYAYEFVKIYGCDPNAAHIAWLSKNYPLADFRVSQFMPPLPFDSNTFDLIYSVSVFSHLSEKAQFAWLEELSRVLKPNQIALLTTLGEHAANRLDLEKLVQRDPAEPESFKDALAQQKFVFYVPESYRAANQVINPGNSSEEDMYGATWHSEDYIYENWSQYFEVIKIIPGCVDGLQDLVVLRKL
ncbi:MAG: class I SAM-dependent methyltransferase [Plectolyngbya sp. WJT66-NPBG17]|jgi:SAM-dependent methyltransferase|nr:class I SAM-dependent methyltransferase [Plectolyngbya sp. WJT66-NPBG17]